MQTFTSDISKKEFSIAEKVTGKSVRQCILDEIKKDCPGFSETSLLSMSELSQYRSRYMQNSLMQESGILGNLETQVISAMQNEELISGKLTEDDKTDLSPGQRLADKVATFGGSWKFIILFGIFIVCWMIINIVFLTSKAFDPFPFILLNLILSCLAAMQAPVIMMSQNRQEEKDRERAKNDYMINLKSEMEIRLLHDKIDHLIINQQEKLMEIQQVQMDMMNDIMDRVGKNKIAE